MCINKIGLYYRVFEFVLIDFEHPVYVYICILYNVYIQYKFIFTYPSVSTWQIVTECLAIVLLPVQVVNALRLFIFSACTMSPKSP